MNLLFRLFTLIVFLQPTMAMALELTGNFTQGGLILGQTEIGSRIDLDGTPVKVGDDGRFLLGFGRDAKPQSELVVIGPNGLRGVRALKIEPRTYKVQRIDGLAKRKVTPDPEDTARIIADNKGIKRVRDTLSIRSDFLSGFIWPVRGPISGVFGSLRVLNGIPKNPHNGVDVAAPQGTVIVAPADGIVALAQNDMFYTGKTLMIDHGLGLTSVYAHMSAILVKEGDRVTQGTPIGKIGKTGRVTGPHLHWGVTLKRTHLDPMLLTGPMIP
ncbi:MAG TPA: M23 family metallopeptidase [Rhodospirillales bacterium]|nr:M23 family metallopeptidase [Rhodospirillales bacterium]